jgi:hypothetical protein
MGDAATEAPAARYRWLVQRVFAVALALSIALIPSVFADERDSGYLWGVGATVLMTALVWTSAKRASGARVVAMMMLTALSLPAPASAFFLMYTEYAWVPYGGLTAVFWLVPWAREEQAPAALVVVARTTENPWGRRPRTPDDPPEG